MLFNSLKLQQASYIVLIREVSYDFLDSFCCHNYLELNFARDMNRTYCGSEVDLQGYA